MDTEKCRVLLCALELGSLSAAADKMGYTPSGVSRIVASLEEEAGFALLLRGKRGVEATRECRQLLPVLEEAIRLEDRFHHQAAQISGLEVGSVSIGTAYFEYYDWLSRLIARYSKRYPGVSINMLEGTSTRLCQAILQHRADLCIISYREEEFDWIPLQADELLAIVGPDHPLANADSYPIGNFSVEPYIDVAPGEETDLSRALEQFHIVPNVRFTTADIHAAAAMVSAGLGVSMVNSIWTTRINQNVRILHLDPPQTVELGVAVSRTASTAAKRFVALLREQIHAL